MHTGYMFKKDTGYRIQDTGYRIQDTGYRYRIDILYMNCRIIPVTEYIWPKRSQNKSKEKTCRIKERMWSGI